MHYGQLAPAPTQAALTAAASAQKISHSVLQQNGSAEQIAFSQPGLPQPVDKCAAQQSTAGPPQPATLKLAQPTAQASVPAPKPCDAQLCPLRFAPSQLSPTSMVPFPQTAGAGQVPPAPMQAGFTSAALAQKLSHWLLQQ